MKAQSLIITGLFLLFIGSLRSQNVYQKTYGGTGNDYGEGIKVMSDAGFILTGTTRSYGTLGAEARDLFSMRADLLGTTVWSRQLGSTNSRQEGKVIKMSSDGGFIMGGRTFESSTDGNDSWLFKKFSAGLANVNENIFGKNISTSGGALSYDDELFALEETGAPYPAIM